MTRLLLLFGMLLSGAEIERKPAQLTDEQKLRFEVLSLKMELLQRQADQISAEQGALVKTVCEAAGIPKEACVVNWREGTIARRPDQKEK